MQEDLERKFIPEPTRSLFRKWKRMLETMAKKVGRRDWRHSWTASSYGGVWMQKMSVAIANEMAIGALRRTPLCTRQRVLGGMGESRDEGYESMSLGRQGAM